MPAQYSCLASLPTGGIPKPAGGISEMLWTL